MTSSPLIVRPARDEDLPHLLKLAKNAGLGMTTVPNTEEAMAERIEASKRAFAGAGRAGAKDIFFFVLDNGDHAVGMASIFPDLGADRPFYSYRLSHIAAQSPESGLGVSSDILFLVNDFHGYEEIGTLLVGEEARGQGAGRLLSLSRLAYMGTRRNRFGDNVMAEIRGWFDEDGTCPFWEHIAAKFFHTSFEEADRLSANDFRFISHLMPKFPIYVSLLPERAQEVISKPHSTSSQALNLLLTENFAISRCIDIFDGGPSIQCPIDRVRTVQERTDRRLTIKDTADHIAGAEPFLISSLDGSDFACAVGMGHREGQTVVLSAATAERADLNQGALVAASPLRAKERT